VRYQARARGTTEFVTIHLYIVIMSSYLVRAFYLYLVVPAAAASAQMSLLSARWATMRAHADGFILPSIVSIIVMLCYGAPSTV
jgi:hypothetical protein